MSKESDREATPVSVKEHSADRDGSPSPQASPQNDEKIENEGIITNHFESKKGLPFR